MNKVIYDNIIFSLQKFGGISTYWYELLSRLINDKEFEASFIINNDSENVFYDELKIGTDKIIGPSKLPILIDRFNNLNIKNNNKEQFIFHSSYYRYSINKEALNVITIHDLIHHKFYSGTRKLLHNYQKNNSLKHSDAIITVSENTKNDLLNYYPNIDSKNVFVIYNGVSDGFFKINDKEYNYNLDNKVIRKNYLLYISSREPYKNFNFVINVLEKLPDFNLYIVGPLLTKKEIANLNIKIPERWQIFTSISSTILNELYNNAHALIFASSYEGFGIPLLEAMKASCPFVALNTSSIPEVAGKAGLLVDELNINDFVNMILKINSQRETLLQLGQSQAAKFSWDKCYQETSNLYKNLLR